MIFRAIAYSTDEHWSDSKAMERVVFVDAETRNDAKLVISKSLTSLWRVPESSVEFYNLESEFELIVRAFGSASTGDQRLITGEGNVCAGSLSYLIKLARIPIGMRLAHTLNLIDIDDWKEIADLTLDPDPETKMPVTQIAE